MFAIVGEPVLDVAPAESLGAAIAFVTRSGEAAFLARIGSDTPTIVLAMPPTSIAGIATISVAGAGIRTVGQVSAGGRTYSEAAIASSIQPGEFLFDPVAQTIQIATVAAIPPGAPIQVQASTGSSTSNTSLTVPASDFAATPTAPGNFVDEIAVPMAEDFALTSAILEPTFAVSNATELFGIFTTGQLTAVHGEDWALTLAMPLLIREGEIEVGAGLEPLLVQGNGENLDYYFDPATNKLRYRIAGRGQTSLNVLLGKLELETNAVLPPFPDLFRILPLEGTFSWSEGFEQQPSGSFNFRTLAALKEVAIALLRPGTTFTAFGVGFAITNLQITEIPYSQQPMRPIQVSVSLGGMHEYCLDNPIVLGRDGVSTVTTTGAYFDPECGKPPASATVAATGITMAQTAIAAGCNYIGPALSIETPSEPTISTFGQELQARIRQLGAFVNYSNPNGVEVKSISAVNNWAIAEEDIAGEISLSVQGIKPQQIGVGGNFDPLPPGGNIPAALLEPEEPRLRDEDQTIFPYSEHYYPPHRIDGRFNQAGVTGNSEDTQSNKADNLAPQWRRIPSVKERRVEGDKDPQVPPANTGRIKSLDCNSVDGSGVKKVEVITELEDGVVTREEENTWGFVVYGRELFDANGELVGVAGETAWRQIGTKKTEHFFDGKTGYRLGSDTSGWILTRYESENPQAPETIALEPGSEDYNLYNFRYAFFTNAIAGKNRDYLLPHWRFYKDDSKLEGVEIYWTCLPNGEKVPRVAYDPNYRSTYFIAASATHENSFASAKNPDDDPPDDPKPKLTTGQETFHRSFVRINQSKNTRNSISRFDDGRNVSDFMEGSVLEAPFSPNRLQDDSYSSYSSDFNATDPGFNASLEITKLQHNQGRPPEAPRKAIAYEKIEPPEPITGDENKKKDPTKYQYLVSTPHSYDPAYQRNVQPNFPVEGGTLSYPHAKTLAEAQLAAKTDITIKNWQNSATENLTAKFSPQFKSGDRLTYVANGIRRKRRILGVRHSVEIQGLVGGSSLVTSPGTQLTLAIDRETPCDFSQRPEPLLDDRDENNQRQYELDIFFIKGEQPLGELLFPDTVTRRNF